MPPLGRCSNGSREHVTVTTFLHRSPTSVPLESSVRTKEVVSILCAILISSIAFLHLAGYPALRSSTGFQKLRKLETLVISLTPIGVVRFRNSDNLAEREKHLFIENTHDKSLFCNQLHQRWSPAGRQASRLAVFSHVALYKRQFRRLGFPRSRRNFPGSSGLIFPARSGEMAA
jgi:hypothetical protein